MAYVSVRQCPNQLLHLSTRWRIDKTVTIVPSVMCPKEEIDLIRKRLRQLKAEQSELRSRLAELEANQFPSARDRTVAPPVTTKSKAEEKVALFRSLFIGREDVFPRRWENSRSGRNGYALACANEWEPDRCGKPKIKCGDCPNQAFLPVTDQAIKRHLTGSHTMGIISTDVRRYLPLPCRGFRQGDMAGRCRCLPGCLQHEAGSCGP